MFCGTLLQKNGCEEKTMKKQRQKLDKSYRTSLVVLIVVLIGIMALITVLIRHTEAQQVETEGQMRLSSIASKVDNTLYGSECMLNSVAMQVEQIISMGGDTSDLLKEYFTPETIYDINSESDISCFSAYAAYENDLYINDFIPDESFVLDERSWYVGAKRRMGAINITDPYIDASTGEMCYSMSKLLSDGKTVVGLDFNLSMIQDFIEEMNPAADGTSLIVTGNGMIVGHSDYKLVGSYAGDHESYKELVNKVFMLYGDSFTYKMDGVKYSIFSDKTNYDWYLIVSMEGNLLKSQFSTGLIVILVIMFIFSVGIVVFFVRTGKDKLAAESALSAKNDFLKEMSYELKRPLSSIVSRADILSDSGGVASSAGAEIGDYAKDLGQMLDNFISISALNNLKAKEKTDKDDIKIVDHKGRIALVTVILFITSVVAVGLNTNTQLQWGETKMQKETESYLYQVQDWVSNNKAVLDVISQSIAAQPDFEVDYDSAVEYLDDIVSSYSDISVAYLCNPEWEHTVLMNNRWEPDDSWHVEERQWYIDTLASNNNFNISAPYQDEQTGYYCTTLSTAVYDEKGNFIGLLGIDYYLDKLIGILGQSYTDTGYSFLTDIDGNILNHPYDEYEMKPDYSVNTGDLCYREAFSKDGSVIIKDYDGKYRVCYAMTEPESGFKVIAVKEITEIYGSGITSNILYILVFLLSIVVVNAIMRNLTSWQAKVNIELKEAAESAINAGRAKNDFLANMSHEIRTPINAVLGMNEMILREAKEKEIVDYATNIHSAGRTLLSIINDILDFSKIESGKMDIVPVEYDISSLINDIVNMIKSRVEKKKLEFITEIDETIPAVLFGDDVRIRQVITNILTNAVKYTPEGSVRFKMSVKEKQDNKLSLEVVVSDTGIGIKEEDIEKLFTSFQRLDQEKNRNIEGTGLGITIVQRLLSMMGSELKVSSVYGQGSTFSFVIEQRIIKDEPVGNFEKRFSAIAETVETACTKVAPNAKILVVDDNDTNLIVAKSLLKRTEAKVETASGGKQCIKLLRKNKYDIVFLDHMMPEMDGIETLHTIKEEELAEQTIFIALTANAIHGARQSYIEAGFDDYLSKPFTGNDIERCLYSHLDSSLVVLKENQDLPKENTQVTVEDTSSETENSLFDANVGISYAGDDMDAYLEILEVFVRNKETKHNLIQTYYEEKNWKNYIIEVHALKSTALTIGSKPLNELAKELELSGKEEKYEVIEEKNASMLELYTEVTGLCREYLAEHKPQNGLDDAESLTEVSVEKVQELINSIKEACDAFDTEVISDICQEASDYVVDGTPLKPLFDEIKAAVDKFDFEEVATKADSVMENLE